jgi:hypothetical protein
VPSGSLVDVGSRGSDVVVDRIDVPVVELVVSLGSSESSSDGCAVVEGAFRG